MADRWTEYLMLPELVAPPDDFVQRAKAVAADAALPGLAARELCALVADEVEYVPGATDVHTTAGRSWQQRAGVCQDMAHLVIGGLRSVGIPARYVSGYHHPSARRRSSASTWSAPRTPGSSGGTTAGTPST